MTIPKERKRERERENAQAFYEPTFFSIIYRKVFQKLGICFQMKV